jgi:hypothetical protein
MDFRPRIDPAEEVRHREAMDGMGMYDAQWAASKVLELSDVKPGQNRLLLTKDTVRAAGSIPRVFPELEELREDGLNAEIRITVPVLDAEGREKEVNLRYLNSNKAYRLMGPEWRLFVGDTGMSRGDRLDLYTCRRGDGERCLFAFRTKGSDVGDWCTRPRKRARQPAAADHAVAHLYAEDCEFYRDGVVVDYTRAKRDRGRDRRKTKNGPRVERGDHKLSLPNDDVHAWGGGLQEDTASWYLDATPDEIEAAKGLLMLKYALPAHHY